MYVLRYLSVKSPIYDAKIIVRILIHNAYKMPVMKFVVFQISEKCMHRMIGECLKSYNSFLFPNILFCFIQNAGMLNDRGILCYNFFENNKIMKTI
jgi:hypothetical protein